MGHRYQEEYEKTDLFWNPEPASYVRKLSEIYGGDLRGLKVLDLGAGEGKNAVFLANLGAFVTAVDLSSLALSRFKLQPNYQACKEHIVSHQCDILDFEFEKATWDIVVAYGVLHCLDTSSEVENIISKIKLTIKNDGVFVGATFTNEIPVPTVQDYLNEEAFVNKGLMQMMFEDWEILHSTDEIIEETHPTSNESHEHSIVRIIARKQKTS